MYHDLALVLQHDLIVEWKEHYKEVFGKHTLLLKNRLHELPVFLPENLARLIEVLPLSIMTSYVPVRLALRSRNGFRAALKVPKARMYFVL
ncbi:hypothetical protein [Pseudovibrio denitrificans]|uniref:hypothetical protein n=1 Tax=Pseudovibrio denitrificans TaxID=258256 RepID=UPI000B1311C9|nr:hypothetical protein [Pseudovibrio denitrificans]